MYLKLLFLLSILSFNLQGQTANEFYNLGIEQAAQSKFRKAILHFDEAIALDKNYDSAYFYRGLSQLELGKYDQAVSDLNTTITVSSSDSTKVRAYYGKAYIFRSLDIDLEKALANVYKAIELDSADWNLFHFKGLILYDGKRYEEAILDFDKAVAMNPDSPLAYYDRALAKRKLMRLEEAVKDYDRVLARDSTHTMALNNRGFAKTMLEDYQGAVEDFNLSLKQDVNSFSYNNRGYAKLKLKDYKGAKKDCELAIKLDPNNSWAYHYLGLIYYEVGKKDKACELFHRALKLGKEEVQQDIDEKC